MASIVDYATQGTRIFLSSLKSRVAPKEYKGNAREICESIVKDCWNGTYFQTSTTNFTQFWTRDFGWCTHSLIKLGYQAEVEKTLRYALNKFQLANKITTTLTPGGKPFDFPTYAVDSLPWLIHSIRLAKFPIYNYKPFLQEQTKLYFEKVINPQTGLVRTDISFSSMKDFALRKSSCYDNTMVAMLSNDLDYLKLYNPFQKYNYKALIMNHFWNGQYFYDDLRKENYIAGDANLFPFLTGVITDQNLRDLAFASIAKDDLDYPFPLKYTKERLNLPFIWQESLLRNYESNSIWTHMGPLYIKLLKEIDPKKAENLRKTYAAVIENHKTYPEVFFPDGTLYSSPVYNCDRGMLWAANFLTL